MDVWYVSYDSNIREDRFCFTFMVGMRVAFVTEERSCAANTAETGRGGFPVYVVL